MIFYLKTQLGGRNAKHRAWQCKDQPLKVTEVVVRKETDDEAAE
jgi:hypothetical protein